MVGSARVCGGPAARLEIVISVDGFYGYVIFWLKWGHVAQPCFRPLFCVLRAVRAVGCPAGWLARVALGLQLQVHTLRRASAPRWLMGERRGRTGARDSQCVCRWLSPPVASATTRRKKPCSDQATVIDEQSNGMMGMRPGPLPRGSLALPINDCLPACLPRVRGGFGFMCLLFQKLPAEYE